MHRDVFIVDGARTPFLKVRGAPGPFKASDLAVYAGRSLLARYDMPASAFGQMILGCVGPDADETNIARLVSLRLGCGFEVPAWTVQRNCASGLQAVDCGFRAIQSGQHELVLAGGTEAMSHAPLLFKSAMVHWLAGLQRAKTPLGKLKQAAAFRPGFLVPELSLMKALRDPIVNLSMGQTAEEIAFRFGITREEMDVFAMESHQKTLRAQKAGYFKSEIVPLISAQGEVFERDDGVREDASVERLAKLRPVFEKQGNITAGNSSQVTDGAALLILASEQAVLQYQLPVLGRIVDSQWSGIDPRVMGLGPVHAIARLLGRADLKLSDIDVLEINEAFSAQVIGCLRAWEDLSYCQMQLGLSDIFAKVDVSRLNTDGGAIAMGHPVGASGARLVMHTLHRLARQGASRGVLSLCIGGGQGGAMLVENLQGGIR